MTEETAIRIGVEAETRLRDLQALLRRIEGKRRDGTVARVVLLVADTKANRAAVASASELLDAAFPARGAAAWVALREGRDPGADVLIFA